MAEGWAGAKGVEREEGKKLREGPAVLVVRRQRLYGSSPESALPDRPWLPSYCSRKEEGEGGANWRRTLWQPL